MNGSLHPLANFLLGAALFYFVFRAGSNRMRVLSSAYPNPAMLDAIHCGRYPYSTWWFYSWVSVSANSDGLALSQIVVPYLWHVRAFVPWEDTIISNEGDVVRIGATKVPSFELVLGRAALTTLQHRLKGHVPFGHVI